MPDRLPPDEEDILAERARDGDHAARRAVVAGREEEARELGRRRARAKGMPHRADDAADKAYIVLAGEAVQTYERPRGPFGKHARVKIRTRVDTWLGRGAGGDRRQVAVDPSPGDDQAGPRLDDPSRGGPGGWSGGFRDPSDLDDASDDPQARAFRAAADAIEDRAQRLKWVAFTVLREPFDEREVTDTLALDAAGVGGDPSVALSWEVASVGLRALRVPGVPPPAPATWGGCVALFCPSPAERSAPRPPRPERVRDPATRATELGEWWTRVRRHFQPGRVQNRRAMSHPGV